MYSLTIELEDGYFFGDFETKLAAIRKVNSTPNVLRAFLRNNELNTEEILIDKFYYLYVNHIDGSNEFKNFKHKEEMNKFIKTLESVSSIFYIYDKKRYYTT